MQFLRSSICSHLLGVGAFAASCLFAVTGYSQGVSLSANTALLGAFSSSSSSSSDDNGKTYTHPIVLDLEDAFWNQYTDSSCSGIDNTITTQVQITVDGNRVYIKTPTLTFTIPSTENSCYTATNSVPPPPGGYVYLKDGFLPKNVRPDSVVPLSFTIASTSYELQIDREGRLKISGPNFTPLAPGTYSILPTSVTYIIKKHYQKAPSNIAISKNASTPNLLTYPGQYLDSQQASIQGDVVAFAYPDNSVHPDQPSCWAAVGKVVSKQGIPCIQITSNKAVIVPDPFVYGYCVAGAGSGISINPINTNNIVLLSPQANNVPLTDAFPLDSFNIYTSYTNNGGTSWSPQARLDNTPLTAFRSDARIHTDPLGNHWVVYSNRGSLYNPATDTGAGILIMVSSNGGANWTQVAEILPPNTNSSGFTYPMLHWGGDGFGGKAMYFSWTFVDTDGSGNTVYKNYMAAIPIQGPGGPFGPITVINNFPQLDGLMAFGEIRATPDGTIVYAAPDVATHSGLGVPQNGLEAHSYLSVALSGLNNFVPGGFSAPRLVDYTTIGSNNSVKNHNVTWQATEGVRPTVGNQGLSFDPTTGRLYAISQTELSPKTVVDSSTVCHKNNFGELNLRWTSDYGQTWSGVVPVRNTHVGQIGDCNINVDPTSGNLVISWYDPREDAKEQQKIKLYAAVMSPPTSPSVLAANIGTQQLKPKKPKASKEKAKKKLKTQYASKLKIINKK